MYTIPHSPAEMRGEQQYILGTDTMSVNLRIAKAPVKLKLYKRNRFRIISFLLSAGNLNRNGEMSRSRWQTSPLAACLKANVHWNELLTVSGMWLHFSGNLKGEGVS